MLKNTIPELCAASARIAYRKLPTTTHYTHNFMNLFNSTKWTRFKPLSLEYMIIVHVSKGATH